MTTRQDKQSSVFSKPRLQRVTEPVSRTPFSDIDAESLPPQELLRRGFELWGRGLVLCTSLQAEGMVLVDMSVRLFPHLRVFTIDTGRLPEETHEFMAQVRRHYGIDLEVYAPDANELRELVTRRGPNAFRDNVLDRRLCCHIRKVRPLDAVLSGENAPRPQAWVTGLRRSQSETRDNIRKLDRDDVRPGLWKLAPLADWTAAQVEAYSREHGVPRHPLYAQGYRSIGCAPCTRPVSTGEHERAGRWWWETDAAKECGLHFQPDGTVRRAFDVALSEIIPS